MSWTDHNNYKRCHTHSFTHLFTCFFVVCACVCFCVCACVPLTLKLWDHLHFSHLVKDHSLPYPPLPLLSHFPLFWRLFIISNELLFYEPFTHLLTLSLYRVIRIHLRSSLYIRQHTDMEKYWKVCLIEFNLFVWLVVQRNKWNHTYTRRTWLLSL